MRDDGTISGMAAPAAASAGDYVLDFLGGRLFRAVLSLGAIVFVWWLVTDGVGVANPLLLPSPGQVLGAAVLLLQTEGLFSGGPYNGNLIGHALISTLRVLLGFVLACAAAIPLGILIAVWSTMEDFLDPVIQILRPIPPLAWTPMAILWFGLGLESIVFLIFIGAFWAILLNTITGVQQVRPILVRAAQSLGASRLQVLRAVVIPAAFPFIFTGMRLAFGAGWITIIAAEIIASSSGLGYLIMSARRILASPDIITGMLSIGLLGMGFDRLFKVVERRLVVAERGPRLGGVSP